jgi:hypothetical protein
MTDDSQKLLEVIGQAQRAALGPILAKIQAKEVPTPQEVRTLRELEKDLKEEETAGGVGTLNPEPLPTVFKNIREVAAYLKEEGWKVGQATLYTHQKEGKIKGEPDGTYIVKSVLKYARDHLFMMSTKRKHTDEELQRRKIKAETGWKEEQLKRERLKRMTEEGRLIERDQFELELAARGALMDTLRQNSIQTLAAERVAIVGGDPARIPDLIAFDLAEHNDMMNQFATTREFHVLFKTAKGKEKKEEREEEN